MLGAKCTKSSEVQRTGSKPRRGTLRIGSLGGMPRAESTEALFGAARAGARWEWRMQRGRPDGTQLASSGLQLKHPNPSPAHRLVVGGHNLPLMSQTRYSSAHHGDFPGGAPNKYGRGDEMEKFIAYHMCFVYGRGDEMEKFIAYHMCFVCPTKLEYTRHMKMGLHMVNSVVLIQSSIKRAAWCKNYTSPSNKAPGKVPTIWTELMLNQMEELKMKVERRRASSSEECKNLSHLRRWQFSHPALLYRSTIASTRHNTGGGSIRWMETESSNRRGEVAAPNGAFWGVSQGGQVETEQTPLEAHFGPRFRIVAKGSLFSDY
ncbi:hypothetical protein KSP40_PGU002568 [Platanthera guangdongensis]|uniref:Uncharacterized protein n=1 Tax=Platanthera guangdongensis TaxID=2320717 RepID=A0ABR2MF70_9ASPA